MSEIKNEVMDPALKAKVKKNLLWLGIFSIMMLFAGLTSGYIVLSGDLFWVKFSLPTAFVYSTIFIGISSLLLIWGHAAIKKGKKGLFKLAIIGAFIFGCLFGAYQFKGWNEMKDHGYFVGGTNPIFLQVGRYGKYYSLSFKGKEINFDGNYYNYEGAAITDELENAMHDFCLGLKNGVESSNFEYELPNYGSDFLLYFKGEVVTYANKKLMLAGTELNLDKREKLKYFAIDRVEGRGDFSMKGIYGEDFTVLYQGEPMEYRNREFFINGQKLSAPLENKLNGAENTASSFVYAFTGVHLLHWFGGMIALLVMLIKGLRERYSVTENLGVLIGARYWHFLGILWLYLYLFLIIIH